MAAAAKHVQLTITSKIPIGGGRAIYAGTALGGTEYETGGTSVEAEATNSRYAMPERWDTLNVGPSAAAGAGLLSTWFAQAQKLKLFALTTVATSTETGLSEFKTAATMATAIPAGTPFWGIGLQ